MANTVEIDKAGRIVIPKKLREQINVSPGDKFEITIVGSKIQLEPHAMEQGLVSDGSLLVFSAGTDSRLSREEVHEVIHELRSGAAKDTVQALKKR